MGILRFWTGLIAFEYLFSQFFFANFSLPTTLAAISGLFIACAATPKSTSMSYLNQMIAISCFVVIMGVIYGTANYYSNHHSPGNYYAWWLHYSFLASVTCIAAPRIVKLVT